jgi:N-acetylmuramoyl-L-alanine amidase
MRHLVFPLALALLLGGGLAGPARAQVGATTTRLTIDGQAARFYPTYGSAGDPELYAPLAEALAPLGLQFRFTPAAAEALLQGKPVASWPIVRATQALPNNGRPTCVLAVGTSYYLPVRAAAALLGRNVAWDSAASLLRLGGAAAAAPSSPAPAAAAPAAVSTPPALDPKAAAQVQAVRANFEAAAAILRRLPLPGGPVVPLALRAGSQAALQAAVAPPPPPIQAIVRRTPGALAFRGGQVRRPNDLLARATRGLLQGKVICVDAGHGGHSTGALGLRGLQEKDACLDIALELAQAFQEAGATVILPRADDTYVSLDERIDFANTRGADLFISIHNNAMPVHNTVSGTETYYDTPQSLALARAIHPRVAGVVGERDGGIRRRGFAVIRRTTMPSVLVEVAYIDNLNDEAKLADPDFRRQVAEAIRDGVLAYYQGQ